MNKELKILGLRTFGHNKAIDFINKSIIMSKTSHAYLITGPENIGKKTLAVDLASILNAKPNKDMFDNQYVIDISSSKERSRILNGNHSDIKIIDKEFSDQTNRSSLVISIDQIRQIIKDIYLKPFEGEKKIYIINQAQNMTESAYNSINFGGAGGYPATTFSMDNTGGGGAHENRPPFYALCYIMKT